MRTAVSKISIKARLAIIAFLAFLPVLFLGYLFVTQSQKDIAFASKELVGNQYLSAIGPEIVALASGQPLPSAERLVADGQAFDAMIGTTAIATEYLGLRDAFAGPGFDPTLSATALALVAKIGDGSNLILDPDLDSFYEMDMQVRHSLF